MIGERVLKTRYVRPIEYWLLFGIAGGGVLWLKGERFITAYGIGVIAGVLFGLLFEARSRRVTPP